MKHFSEISSTAERVVDAAEGLVQQHGYNGFSYDDVARLVGIKKPSKHHHFPTKSDLVAVVAQRYTHRFREHLLKIDGSYAKAPERLAAYAALFERTFAEDRRLCVCGMLGAEADSLPEDVVSEADHFFRVKLEWLTRLLSDGQRTKSIRLGAKPEELAESFLCALEGAMIVGRGLHSSLGPCVVANTFIFAVQS